MWSRHVGAVLAHASAVSGGHDKMKTLQSMLWDMEWLLTGQSRWNISFKVKETRRTLRDSEAGVEKMAIGQHLGQRGRVCEKRRIRGGNIEEEKMYMHMDESKFLSLRRAVMYACSLIDSMCCSGVNLQRPRFSPFQTIFYESCLSILSLCCMTSTLNVKIFAKVRLAIRQSSVKQVHFAFRHTCPYKRFVLYSPWMTITSQQHQQIQNNINNPKPKASAPL